MARRPTGSTEPRSELYSEKQAIRRVNQAGTNLSAQTLAIQSAERVSARWNAGFGEHHKAWLASLKTLQSDPPVPKLAYAGYKAFIGEYVSKVRNKGTETTEMVVSKFTRLGLDSSKLTAIVAVIGEVLET
jgi:hypothetical protein